MSKRTAEPNRYSAGAIALHWLIAAALLFQIGLGWRMEGPDGPERFAIFQLHKSVGIAILLLTLVRIAWRLTHRPPAFPPTMQRWERGLAHVTHLGFYLLLLGLPLTGWLLVSTSRIDVPTILFGVLPWPHVPWVRGLEAESRHVVHEAAEFGHHAFVFIAYALFVLHVAGALKHHFFERGGDLARMLPARRSRLTLWLGVAALAMAAALFAGNRLPLGAVPAPAIEARPPVAAAPAPEPAPVEAEKIAPVEPAAEKAVEAQAVSEAKPARWTVDQDVSSLHFTTRWSNAEVRGQFERWSADIAFDPRALDQSSVKVSIDMASATTGSADTQSALPGDDWFAVARHPQATFEANSFRKLADDRYEARGTLNLRGVSRPVTLPFTLTITGDRARMSGRVQIDRISFGVGQGQWTATSTIPAEVTVEVALMARRRTDESAG